MISDAGQEKRDAELGGKYDGRVVCASYGTDPQLARCVDTPAVRKPSYEATGVPTPAGDAREGVAAEDERRVGLA